MPRANSREGRLASQFHLGRSDLAVGDVQRERAAMGAPPRVLGAGAIRTLRRLSCDGILPQSRPLDTTASLIPAPRVVAGPRAASIATAGRGVRLSAICVAMTMPIPNLRSEANIPRERSELVSCAPSMSTTIGRLRSMQQTAA